jgi:hypothetical protein
MKKLTIEVPIPGYISKKQEKEFLDEMYESYEIYNFVVSGDDEYHYEKYDDNRKAFLIFLNIGGYSRQKAQQVIFEKMEAFESLDYEILFAVSRTEDKVVSLSQNEDLSEIENIINSWNELSNN